MNSIRDTFSIRDCIVFICLLLVIKFPITNELVRTSLLFSSRDDDRLSLSLSRCLLAAVQNLAFSYPTETSFLRHRSRHKSSEEKILLETTTRSRVG